MAKAIDEQTKFNELRAKGHSFDKIAQEIKTSKPTLIEWQKKIYRANIGAKVFIF